MVLTGMELQGKSFISFRLDLNDFEIILLRLKAMLCKIDVDDEDSNGRRGYT